MAIRNDFNIDWNSSPRVITILSPSTECTMQDLLDTLRFMEAQPIAMDNPSIVDASDKETLDTTTKVGITVTLQNAIAGFEARPGPSWVGCAFIGGNMVASDTSGNTIDSLNYTAFVSPSKTSSASATLQEQDALQYASYGGEVSLDINEPTSGIEFPSGTQEFPVNNMADAVLIASVKGFTTIGVRSDLTLDTGDDVSGLVLVGKSHVNTNLVVNTGADCLRTVFKSFNITGVLDGESDIFDCIVQDLDYFDGHIHNSMLNGIVTLSGSANATIRNCSSLDVLTPPVIDSNNSLQDLSMPNWSGILSFINVTQNVTISAGVDAGQLILDASCSDGTIALSGNGELVDNSGINCYVRNSMVDGLVVNSLQRSIEYLRPHHTGSGKMFFWNPYDGNDNWDGLTTSTACKTFKHIHDNLAKNAHHDIIMAVSGNHSGITVSNENIIISKDYLFLRGPGRDFNIVSLVDNLSTVTISGRGGEVSGMRIASTVNSVEHAIHTTGDFSLIKNVYVYNSNNGIFIESGEYTILDTVKIHHGTGYGVKVGSNTEHIDIQGCHIGSNTSDGLVIESQHEVNVLNCNIHANTGYGINIAVGANATIIDADTNVFNNTAGDINDLGSNTFIATADISADLGIINRNVIKASKLIPANEGIV